MVNGYFADTTGLMILWTLWTLLCIGVLIFCIVLRVQKLLKSNVNTSIQWSEPKNLSFPKVSICNENSYDASAASYFNVLIANELYDLVSNGFWKASNIISFKIMYAEFIASRKFVFSHYSRFYQDFRSNDKLISKHMPWTNMFGNTLFYKGTANDIYLKTFSSVSLVTEFCIVNPKILPGRIANASKEYCKLSRPTDVQSVFCDEKVMREYDDATLCRILMWGPTIDENWQLLMLDPARINFGRELAHDSDKLDWADRSVFQTYNRNGEIIKFLNQVNVSKLILQNENAPATTNLVYSIIEKMNINSTAYSKVVDIQTGINRFQFELKMKLIWLAKFSLEEGQPLPLSAYPTMVKLTRFTEFRTNIHDELWDTGNQITIDELKELGFMPIPDKLFHLMTFNGERLDPSRTLFHEADRNGLLCMGVSPNLYQHVAGPNGGMKIALYTGLGELNQFTMNMGYFKNPSWSLHLDLHGSPFIGSTIQKINIHNSRKTSIGIVQQSFERIPSDDNPCSESQKQNFVQCVVRCQVDHVESICNCWFSVGENKNGFDACGFDKAFEEECYNAMVSVKKSDFADQCDCNLPCSEKTYQTSYAVGNVGLEEFGYRDSV